MTASSSKPESLGDPRLDERFDVLSTRRRSSTGSSHMVRDRQAVEAETVCLDLVTMAGVEPDVLASHLDPWRPSIGVEHSGRATLLDVGTWTDGAFVVRRSIDGTTLRAVLDARGASEPLDPVLAVALARQMLDILGDLHVRGLRAHAPSPDDWVLDVADDGSPRVVLADSGVGRALRSVARPATATLFVGHLRYAAPETFDPSASVGSSTDLYAVGLMLYEVLTGRFPIAGETPSALLAGHVLHPPLDFAESDPDGRVPDALRQVTRRLLAKLPAERYADTGSASAALDQAVEGRPAPASTAWRIWLAGADPAAGVTVRVSQSADVPSMPPPPPPAAGSEPASVPASRPEPQPSDPASTTIATDPAPGSVTMPMSVVEAAKARERRRAAEAASAESPTPSAASSATSATPSATPPRPRAEPRAATPPPSMSAPTPAATPPAPGPQREAQPAFDDLGFDASPSPPPRHTRRSPPGRSAARLTTVLGVGVVLIGIFLVSFKLSGGDLDPAGWWRELGERAERYRANVSAEAAAASGEPAAERRSVEAGDPSADEAAGASTGGAAPSPTFDAFDAANAEPGALRLDAAPWAEIEVIDAAGGVVPIAGARVTPRRVELPPGRYTIRFVYPPGDHREQREVVLASGDAETVRVDFGLDAEDYFRHVGY